MSESQNEWKIRMLHNAITYAEQFLASPTPTSSQATKATNPWVWVYTFKKTEVERKK